MRQHIFTFTAAVSLVLFVATVALAVRSRYVSEIVRWHRRGTEITWIFGDAGGTCWIARYDMLSDFPPGFSSRSDTFDPAFVAAFEAQLRGRTHHAEFAGVHWSHMLTPPGRTHPADERVLALPIWYLVAILFVLPARAAQLVVRRLRGRRRVKAGRCPTCGYDMRATRERCPECGTPATTAAGVAA